MITFEEAKGLFTYDRETGIIKWRKRIIGQRADPVAGGPTSKGHGYGQVNIKGKRYPAHRIAMLLAYGFYGEGLEVDHINHVRNKSRSSRNTTGVMGVCYDKGTRKYRAQIQIDGVSIYLGEFVTLEEAANARKDADIKYKFNTNHGNNKAKYVTKKTNARLSK